jgi:PAS domain S-box-containing protein
MVGEGAKERQLRYTLIEKAPFPAFVATGSSLRIEYANRAALNFLDGKFDRVVGKTLNEICPEIFSRVDIASILRDCLTAGHSFRIKGKQIKFLQHAEAHVRWVDVDCEPVTDEAGKVTGVICYIRDVTSERIPRTSLGSRPEDLINFFKVAPIGIVCYRGANFIVDAANDQALFMWGKTLDEVKGKPIEEIFPQVKSDPVIRERHRTSVEKMQLGERHVVDEVELVYDRDDGPHSGWYSYIHEPYTDASGKIAGMMAIAIEVTDQVVARNKLQLVTDSLPSPISYVNSKEQYTFVNKAYETWFGVDRNAIVGKTVAEVLGQAVYDSLYSRIEKVFLGEIHQSEGWVQYKNDTRKYITAHYIPHVNEKQKVVGYVSLITDLTERKVQEEAKRESDERLSLVTDAINAGTFDYDIENERIHWSSKLKKLVGVREDATVTQELAREILHPEDRDIVLTKIDSTRSGSDQDDYTVVEYRIIRKDSGEVRWIHTRTKTFYRNVDGEQRAVRMLGFSIDITESKIKEERLKQFNAQLEEQVVDRTKELSRLNRVLAEAQKVSKLGSWEWDISTSQITWSDEMFSIYGYNEKFPVDFTRATERMTAEASELSRKRTDAHVKRAFDNFAENGSRISDIPPIEFKIKLPDSHEKILRNSGKIYLTTEGKLEKIFGAVQDVTEIRSTEQQLQAAVEKLEEKNSDLEAFSYVASHDLKEPLRKIITFTDRLKHGDIAKAETYLSKIDGAALRMMDLIESILTVSQMSNSTIDLADVDLNAVLETCKSDLEIRIRETGAVITAKNLGVVTANFSQINQLFTNLIGNSLKFCNEKPYVEISLDEIGVGEAKRELRLRQQQYWRLSFGDNGIGFDPKYKEQVFEPFKRLHGNGPYGGTGIGLSIVKKIVERHRGGIDVESSPGHGTKFIIYLPK